MALVDSYLSRVVYSYRTKWKHGERIASRERSDRDASLSIPSVVLAPIDGFDHETGRVLSPDEYLKRFGPRFGDAFGRRPAFVDLRQLTGVQSSNGVPFIVDLFEQAFLSGGMPIPLASLGQVPRHQNILVRLLKKQDLGFALRLSGADLEDPHLEEHIGRLLKVTAFSPRNVVIFIDLEHIGHVQLDAFADALVQRMNTIPFVAEWAKVFICGGSFPKDIRAKPNTMLRYDRREWALFQLIAERKSDLLRMPFFSDNLAEHYEIIPHSDEPRSASVHLRFAHGGEWIVVRGKRSVGDHYAGIDDVCRIINDAVGLTSATNFGERFVLDRLAGRGGPGNPSVWRAVAASRHISVVLSSLVPAAPQPEIAYQHSFPL